MKTAITEMFGIKYPIICGAMMWLCKPTLCAAISNAGGMGNLTAANYETEEGFRNAIRETRKLTDRPFMVGQSIGLIQDVPTCKELLERMVKEAEETLERVSKLF